MNFAICLSILISYVFVRIVLFKKNKSLGWRIADLASHLLNTKYIYKLEGKIEASHKNFFFDTNDYPNGFYYFNYLLRIPWDFIYIKGEFISFFWDLILLVSVFCLLGTKTLTLTSSIFFILISFGPALWSHSGRVLHYSERPFGVFWGNLSILGLAFALQGNYYGWLIFFVSSLNVFSSSKFAIQSVVFISFFTSLLSLNPIPVFILISSFLGSNIVLRAYPFKVLKGLIRHLTYLNDLYKRSLVWKTANYKNFLLFFKKPTKSGLKSLLITNGFIKSIVFSLPLFLVMFTNLDSGINVVIAAVILTGIIVATKFFTFVGEPERYIEFGYLAGAYYLNEKIFLHQFWLLVPLSLALFYVYFKLVILPEIRSKDSCEIYESNLELIDFFKDKQGVSICSAEFRTCVMLGLFYDENKYLSFIANLPGNDIRAKFKLAMSSSLRSPTNDFELLKEEYGMEYFIDSMNATQLEAKIHGGNYYNFSNTQLAFENKYHKVYKL